MQIRLPSRYEDLDQAFRGRLRPVPSLLDAVQKARKGMLVSGGLRFLPLYGESGSGKSSAARELGTHLPEAFVATLPREAIESFDVLKEFMRSEQQLHAAAKLYIGVIDQYEEAVAARSQIPSQFVEWLSLLDRNPEYRNGWIFLWLTTSQDFQRLLVQATSRNRRILVDPAFELKGPPREDWTGIIEETFEFHNNGRALADHGVLASDIDSISGGMVALGGAMEAVAHRLGETQTSLQDLSIYQIVMLWPVTDGQRINTILRFVHARDGYQLDWNAWYRELNDADRVQLPLSEYNRARLYFDVRLVPIAAADLHRLCLSLDDDEFRWGDSYERRFSLTHYFSIVGGTWDATKYSPLRERDSERAEEARDWYLGVTDQPTKIGKRLSRVLKKLGIESQYEQTIQSPHGAVRADILSSRSAGAQTQVITELKMFSPEQTMPSKIRDAIRTTLRRHAQFAGFLRRQ